MNIDDQIKIRLFALKILRKMCGLIMIIIKFLETPQWQLLFREN